MAYVVDDEIEEYAIAHTRSEPQYLCELAAYTQDNMDCPQMLTGRLEGRFLKMLVQMIGPKLALEVGTYSGYSALSIAEGLPEGDRLITCEIDLKAQQVAREAFDKSPYASKIELHFGDALNTIRNLREEVDFAFIDADKVNYPQYYQAILELMPSGGVMVIDNMLWSGRVLDPQDKETKAIAELNQLIVEDHRVENVLLTVRDGVQLVRKK